MKKIKKLHCLIRLINRIFKNGQKYKVFKYFKNILFLFKFLKIRLKKKLNFIKISPNIIEDEILDFLSPSFYIEISKKNKKSKKVMNSYLIKNNTNYRVLFKLWYLLIFKIKVRTFKKKIFYLFYSLYINTFWIYRMNDRSQKMYKKKISVSNKRSTFLKKIVRNIN